MSETDKHVYYIRSRAEPKNTTLKTHVVKKIAYFTKIYKNKK